MTLTAPRAEVDPYRAISLTLANGGGTFRASDLSPVTADDIPAGTEAWCVGFGHQGQRLRSDDPLSPLRLLEVRAHCRRQGIEYVGTWINAAPDVEDCYIDPVTILPTLDEALALAEREGEAAVYGLHNGQTVQVEQ